MKDEIKIIKTDFITDNKHTLWEFVKCKIRTETMIFSSIKAKKTNETLNILERKLKELENDLESETNNINHANYLQCKGDWEKILKNKAGGIKLRSKAKWVEDGEKNAKYFLNLEKRNYNSTCIKKLISKNEKGLTDIKEQQRFYNVLYSS